MPSHAVVSNSRSAKEKPRPEGARSEIRLLVTLAGSSYAVVAFVNSFGAKGG